MRHDGCFLMVMVVVGVLMGCVQGLITLESMRILGGVAEEGYEGLKGLEGVRGLGFDGGGQVVGGGRGRGGRGGQVVFEGLEGVGGDEGDDERGVVEGVSFAFFKCVFGLV